MHNYVPNDTLLFTKCINLNKKQCLYSKSPEMSLSLFSDPENFAIDNQKIRELNDQCLGCDVLQRKSMGGRPKLCRHMHFQRH
jgi:hypothetical protein